MSSKRRKCTAEVFVSLLRSRSSSAIASDRRVAVPTSSAIVVLDAAQAARARAALVDVVVLDQHRRLEVARRRGSAGCRRRVPPRSPSASKMRSMRSISCTWYCTVRRSSKISVRCAPRWTVRVFLCAMHARAERGCARARSLRVSESAAGEFFHGFPSGELGECVQAEQGSTIRTDLALRRLRFRMRSAAG